MGNSLWRAQRILDGLLVATPHDARPSYLSLAAVLLEIVRMRRIVMEAGPDAVLGEICTRSVEHPIRCQVVAIGRDHDRQVAV